MNSKDLLKDNLERCTNRVFPMLEAAGDISTIQTTANGGAHPLWVVGHLAFNEAFLIQNQLLGKPNPLEEWTDLFANGSEPVPDASAYPPFEEVLRKCRELRESTPQVLQSQSEADLDGPCANVIEPLKKTLDTRRRCFQLACDHGHMHRGQIADARRAAGA